MSLFRNNLYTFENCMVYYNTNEEAPGIHVFFDPNSSHGLASFDVAKAQLLGDPRSVLINEGAVKEDELRGKPGVGYSAYATFRLGVSLVMITFTNVGWPPTEGSELQEGSHV